jgi:hypothetical protein
MSRAALVEAAPRENSRELRHEHERAHPVSQSHASSSSLPTVTVEIGGIPILLQPSDPKFCDVLESRYESFATRNAPETTLQPPQIPPCTSALSASLRYPFSSPSNDPRASSNANTPACRFEIHLDPRGRASNEDARVTRNGPLWHFRRGDFDATWDPGAGHGRITQCPNPYSIDTVLRITHSLVLAQEGGFLLHAASAIRNNRAFLFAGISGAGKTTMSRLAPADATVLTDEISYVRRSADKNYLAYGTPFAGELARVGANTSAPLEALYLLVQGPENRIAPISKADAARAIMRHVLFFAEEKDLVARVFDSVLEFVSRVHVAQLIFTPDARAWELIK